MSSGPDEVYAKVLKECKKEFSYPLAALFNSSIQSGIVLKAWKLTNAVPIFKKGDRTIASNYLPNSLTSTVGKLIE